LEKAVALLRLSRIEHGVMVGFAVTAGAISAGVTDPGRIAVGVVSALLAEVFLFATNDILNLEEDRINSPERPLVKGELSVEEAWAFSLSALALSLILSALLNWWAVVIIIFAASLGFAYNCCLKRSGILGNAVVALLTAISFLYGGIGVAGVVKEKIVLFTAIAFTANVGREIAKGIRDIVGDRAAGISTVAVLFGVRAAGVLASIFMASAVAMSFIGFRYVTNKLAYGLLIGFTDALFTYSAFLAAFCPSMEVASRVRKLTLVGMAVAILAFMT